jgi:hypothetical protein
MLCHYSPFLAANGFSGTIDADFCIYGGSAGGVTAAVEAARLGHRVVLLEPGPHVGGMTASGLGYTDIGNKAAIGGLARGFYRAVGKAYGVEEAWTFEPHVAQAVFQTWLKDAGVRVYRRQYLARIETQGLRIRDITTESGLTVRASMFIDATYEGDLLAEAGVGHRVGREDNSVYRETLNGAQISRAHQFDAPIDPYFVPKTPASGLLPGIEVARPVVGRGDSCVQAYCFRMCLTDDPDNRLPFARPAGYQRSQYELLARQLATGWREVFNKFDRLRVSSKTDTNNHGPISTDFIGHGHAWARASHPQRESIFRAHVDYQQGLQWFLANDPAIPEDIRASYSRWGLCRDEFTETGGWPHQLYVREARRMIGYYVMTEHDCRGQKQASDSIGLAAYTMDSHNCRRFVDERGFVRNEGDVQVHGFPPYPISYHAIVPKIDECPNLIVPVCLSASHIAYGSIRMEPVFMSLGQVAAIAGHMALENNVPTQEVPYPALAEELRKAKIPLQWTQGTQVFAEALHACEA